MSIKRKKLYSTPWQKIANSWKNYTPPARPAKSDLKVIEKYFKDYIKVNNFLPKVLILGVTPEFRDLCAIYNLSVVTVDINLDMKKSMDYLVKRKNKKEKFLLSDWLTVNKKLLKNSFDFILSDFSVNNIPQIDRHKFFLGINNILKKEGYFITRDFVAKNNRKNLFKIMNRYLRKKKVNYTELWWDLLFNITYSERKRIITDSKFKNLDTKSLKPRAIKVLNNFFMIYSILDKEWTVYTKVQQEREYKKYFSIVNIFYNKDYYLSEICPIYILKKR